MLVEILCVTTKKRFFETVTSPVVDHPAVVVVVVDTKNIIH